jgi:hypothetical protein
MMEHKPPPPTARCSICVCVCVCVVAVLAGHQCVRVEGCPCTYPANGVECICEHEGDHLHML